MLTVLSQNTNDRNRDVAYGRLRERFPSWEEVRRAPRGRGRGRDPARRARADEGGPDRAHPRRHRRGRRSARRDDLGLAGATRRSRRRATTSCDLPGVGRKTAACVLLFSFGRHDVPVDTHVFRVGTRLGLFRPGASFDEAHDEMLRLCPEGDAYEVHVLLIRHGRRTCAARAPRCGECPLRRMCPEGRRRRLEPRSSEQVHDEDERLVRADRALSPAGRRRAPAGSPACAGRPRACPRCPRSQPAITCAGAELEGLERRAACPTTRRTARRSRTRCPRSASSRCRRSSPPGPCP